MTGTVMDTVPKVSPISEGGLGVPLLLHFTHPKKRIIEKMKEFVNKQITRLEDEIELHDDDDIEEMVAEVDFDVEEHQEDTQSRNENDNNIIVID